MKILNLFRPTEKEKAIEAELTGKPSTRQKVIPPRRGLTPAQIEVEELRVSLQAIESRLQATTHERDSLKAEFSQYRSASQSDVRELERENRELRSKLTETSQMLSQQIASTGHQGPLPGFEDDTDETQERSDAAWIRTARKLKGQDGPHGLQRAIQAHQRDTASNQRLTRPEI